MFTLTQIIRIICQSDLKMLHVNQQILIHSVRNGIPKERGCILVIIPNGVHVHTHWDPVFLVFLVGIKWPPLCTCATSAWHTSSCVAAGRLSPSRKHDGTKLLQLLTQLSSWKSSETELKREGDTEGEGAEVVQTRRRLFVIIGSVLLAIWGLWSTEV